MQRFQQHKYALGSEAYITIIVEDEQAAVHIFEELWQKIVAFEQRFSRFLPTSELTEFNAHAGKTRMVSDEFRDVLLAARHFAKITNGLYDPFILPALQSAGYKGSWPTPENGQAATSFESRKVVSWQELVIETSSATIPAHAALDFGGIGKGYLLDELGRRLLKKGVQNFWLSLGGDILCAGFDMSEPWHIGIQHALLPNEIVSHVTNKTGVLFSIATSGVTKRKGESWHHIIDPRTGRSAETHILTATICAASATEADVLAKCVVIDEAVMMPRVTNALTQSSIEDNVVIKQKGSIWN
jgi:thiamine biosynthesis lipoprotein